MKGKIPTFAEFLELIRLYQSNVGRFDTFMSEFGHYERDDFYDWWNNYHGDDEIRDFQERYSKLGKMLAGVDDV